MADGGGHLSRARSHLATVQDSDENAFIALLGNVDLWIGANDIAANGVFVWVTGEPFAYTNFSAQDGNGDGTNRCGLMNALDNHQWYDRRCSDKNAFVCEFE